MTHYEKLATMIFRIFGAFLLVLSAISFILALCFGIFAIFDSYGKGSNGAILLFVVYTVPTGIFGFIFFKLSRFLAKFVCYDFDEK